LYESRKARVAQRPKVGNSKGKEAQRSENRKEVEKKIKGGLSQKGKDWRGGGERSKKTSRNRGIGRIPNLYGKNLFVQKGRAGGTQERILKLDP